MSNLSNVQTLERLRKTLLSKVLEGTGSEYEDCYGTFKKLITKSDRSKSDIAKELIALAQILCFLQKNRRRLMRFDYLEAISNRGALRCIYQGLHSFANLKHLNTLLDRRLC